VGDNLVASVPLLAQRDYIGLVSMVAGMVLGVCALRAWHLHSAKVEQQVYQQCVTTTTKQLVAKDDDYMARLRAAIRCCATSGKVPVQSWNFAVVCLNRAGDVFAVSYADGYDPLELENL
jgi:hypothetical protein